MPLREATEIQRFSGEKGRALYLAISNLSFLDLKSPTKTDLDAILRGQAKAKLDHQLPAHAIVAQPQTIAPATTP